MPRATPTPGPGTLEEGQTGLNDTTIGVVSAGTEYTTPCTFTLEIPPPSVVTCLRCHTCHAGYFTAGAPGPQPCTACTGGRLQPVALWDLRADPVPSGMLARPVAQGERP
jgi:hypothetical protein